MSKIIPNLMIMLQKTVKALCKAPIGDYCLFFVQNMCVCYEMSVKLKSKHQLYNELLINVGYRQAYEVVYNTANCDLCLSESSERL